MGAYNCDNINDLLGDIEERKERSKEMKTTKPKINPIQQYIKTEDLQKFILNYITSDELEQVFKSTNFYAESNSIRFYEAIQFGMVLIGSVVGTSLLPKYYFQEGEN